MQVDYPSDHANGFPHIQFRKKRLTVTIHAQFDMASTHEVSEIKSLIQQATAQLAKEGDAKVSYAVSDV